MRSDNAAEPYLGVDVPAELQHGFDGGGAVARVVDGRPAHDLRGSGLGG